MRRFVATTVGSLPDMAEVATAAVPTPAARGLAMPPEFAAHERTYLAWPCRRELWGPTLDAAKAQYAGVANAVAAFEPVTMACADAADAAEARAALAGEVEVVELPLDDSWLRDSGPAWLLSADGTERVGVHFGFNAWGQKFSGWERDAAVGARLVEHARDEVVTAPFVLEGGSFALDGAGTLLTTEQCLLHPSRNPTWSREDLEGGLRDYLGVERVVWLGDGLAEDRDTDGHVDLVAVCPRRGTVLLQSTAPGTPDHVAMADNHARARDAGLEVLDFPLLAHAEVAGEVVVCSYLNLYLSDRFAVVPLAGAPTDDEALERIADALGGQEVVGVPGDVLAYGGGGPHCITQQLPRRSA